MISDHPLYQMLFLIPHHPSGEVPYLDGKHLFRSIYLETPLPHLLAPPCSLALNSHFPCCVCSWATSLHPTAKSHCSGSHNYYQNPLEESQPYCALARVMNMFFPLTILPIEETTALGRRLIQGPRAGYHWNGGQVNLSISHVERKGSLVGKGMAPGLCLCWQGVTKVADREKDNQLVLK